MADNQQQNPNPTPPPASAGSSSPKRSSTPAVFGDGSTKEQQDQLVKEAKEANQQVREMADAERKARTGD